MILAVPFFFYFKSFFLDQNMSFPSYSILLAASSIILFRSRTERKPRGSTLSRAVRLVVRRMKIVSRGNATWFAGHRVARAIARHTFVLYYFSFVSLSRVRSSNEYVDDDQETLFRRPCDIYTEVIERTRALAPACRETVALFVSTQL